MASDDNTMRRCEAINAVPRHRLPLHRCKADATHGDYCEKHAGSADWYDTIRATLRPDWEVIQEARAASREETGSPRPPVLPGRVPTSSEASDRVRRLRRPWELSAD